MLMSDHFEAPVTLPRNFSIVHWTEWQTEVDVRLQTELGSVMFSVKMLHQYEQIIREVLDFLHYTQALIKKQ